MPIFVYKAKKITGELIKGTLQADNVQAAAARLDADGLFLSAIRQSQTAGTIFRRVGNKELIEFTRDLAALINAGYPLLASLETLSNQTEFPKLRSIISELISQIKDGKPFSQALRKNSAVFSQFYTALAKVGESGGSLGAALSQAAEFMEDELDFHANLISIITYPLIIIGVGICTVGVLLKIVIPKITVIFQDLGQVLPWPTRTLIELSNFINQYWFLITGILIIIAIAARQIILRNRQIRDKCILRIPILGNIIKKNQIYRFSRALGALLTNGVTIDAALEVIKQTLSNIFIRNKIEKVSVDISQGVALSQALKRTEIFPAAFINIVTVGEESGKLPLILQTTAQEYSRDIARRLKMFLSMLEPALILGVGLIIGYIVLAMLLPIFSLDFNF